MFASPRFGALVRCEDWSKYRWYWINTSTILDFDPLSSVINIYYFILFFLNSFIAHLQPRSLQKKESINLQYPIPPLYW